MTFVRNIKVSQSDPRGDITNELTPLPKQLLEKVEILLRINYKINYSIRV